MKKIISLFKRDYEGTRLVYDEIVEGAEWVIAGEGTATEKIDGTSCLLRYNDGQVELLKRYDAKSGKTPPINFVPAQDPDPVTGHYPGWIPVHADNKADMWYLEGLDNYLANNKTYEYGTFELIGEKVQKNPYGLVGHTLVKHGAKVLDDVPTDFEGLRDYLVSQNIEGIVWHHPDGRMVKIKKRDFGLEWAV